MRSTVTIEKDILDRLVRATKAKNKSSAVKQAIGEYLRREKVNKIMMLKGKLEFDLDAEALRRYER
jgi:metal-responsive CopG/Arc/MetJ family transcriptional regulator